MKRRHWVVAVVVALLAPLMSGCWDRLEIEDRATILGLSIDPLQGANDVKSITGKYSRSDAEGYKITVQVAIPGRISLGPSSSSGGGGGTQQPVWIVTTTGSTIDDAMNHLQQQLAEKVFLGHLRVIIVNEQLAQTVGLQDVQDFFRRNAEIRRLAWLIISTGPASDAIKAAPKLERVPALYLTGTMQHAAQIGKLPNIFIGNYWSVLSSLGQEPVLPLVDVIEDERIESEGLAVFKGEKMVGKLNALETASFMEITNDRRAGYGIGVPVPGDSRHSLILRGTNRKERVKLHQDKRQLSADIYSRIEANIEERTGKVPVDNVMPQVAEKTGQVLADGQAKLIQKTQAWGTDIFGFGEFVRGRYPGYWVDKIKTREQWDEVYRQLPIHVHVKLYLRRSGMSTR